MNRLQKGIVTVAISVATVVALAPPANAHEWTEPATWSNGHSISTTGTNQGNLISMWQMFVATRYWPERYSAQTPRVTGTYGTESKNYTKFWQAEHNVANDGIVGPNTWNAARFWHVAPNPTEYGGWRLFKYRDSTGYPGVANIPYTPPFGTWFVEGCGGSYNREHITHPTVTISSWVCD